MSQIAAHLRLDNHAITPLVDRLEHAGLVRRHRSDSDRRVIQIELTTDGTALEAAAAEVQRGVVRCTELEPHALTELREMLKALVHRMEPESSHAQQEDRIC